MRGRAPARAVGAAVVALIVALAGCSEDEHSAVPETTEMVVMRVRVDMAQACA